MHRKQMQIKPNLMNAYKHFGKETVLIEIVGNLGKITFDFEEYYKLDSLVISLISEIDSLPREEILIMLNHLPVYTKLTIKRSYNKTRKATQHLHSLDEADDFYADMAGQLAHSIVRQSEKILAESGFNRR